jgi:hypothetical protein
MNRFTTMLAIVAAAGCAGDLTTTPNEPPPGSTSGDQSTTFDHQNDGISPWDLLDRLQKEGPPRYTSHVHSCPKVRVRTLASVMTAVGINPTNMTALSAGDLYTTGSSALGGPNYGGRIRENISITTSGASKEFDIFAAGADEVIAAFAANTMTRCPGTALFDATNACQPAGITCLIAQPATTRHLDYCNLIVQNATDAATGKRLAVAAMLAAAYTCE